MPRLKQLAPKAAIIMLTGYGDLDSTISAIRHGVTDYILKPINPDALRANLARIAKLREAELRAQQAERLSAIGETMTFLVHESRNAFQLTTTCLTILERFLKNSPDALSASKAHPQAPRPHPAAI